MELNNFKIPSEFTMRWKRWEALSTSKTAQKFSSEKLQIIFHHTTPALYCYRFDIIVGVVESIFCRKSGIFFHHSENFSSTHSTFLLFRRRCHRLLGMLSPPDRVQTRRRLWRRENAKWMENPGLENMDENYEKCHFTFPPYLILTHNFFHLLALKSDFLHFSFMAGTKFIVEVKW